MFFIFHLSKGSVHIIIQELLFIPYPKKYVVWKINTIKIYVF